MLRPINQEFDEVIAERIVVFMRVHVAARAIRWKCVFEDFTDNWEKVNLPSHLSQHL